MCTFFDLLCSKLSECETEVKDTLWENSFYSLLLNSLRFQASRPSIAMAVAFVRTSAAKPATELSMQHAWGRPAGTCRRIVARDAEQGNEASWVTNHLFLRHVSPMNWKICLTKLLRLNWIYKKKTRGEAGREVRERSPKDASAATKTRAQPRRRQRRSNHLLQPRVAMSIVRRFGRAAI